MSGQSSGQTPRTSTSSRPSPSSSSDPNDPSNVDGDRDPGTRDGSVNRTAAATQASDEHLRRRHRPRNSGGFLLPTAPPSISNPPTYAEPEISEKVKGKRKVEDGDLVVSKRASAHQRHRQKPSVGSSPLAMEVSNAHVSEQPDGSTGSTNKRTSGLHSSHKSKDTWAASALLDEEEYPDNRTSTLAFDTDPAQIVNLALNLSESRRRNFSSGSHLVPRESIGSRRLVPIGQPTLGLPNSTGGGSLRQHLQQQRQISRNVSPRSSRSVSGKGAESPMQHKDNGARRRTSALPDFGCGQTDAVIIDASDATFARVEKARTALELAYEYRRLLQYLPKLPTPPQSKKSAPKSRTIPAEGLGRVYNPLQYIRNRKVRFNEKRPLDIEREGWNVLENVRPWVDTVALEREDGLSRVDRRFPLPPFSASQHGLAITDNTQAVNPQVRKIPRPHTVWEFAASDLLADAYWVHQDDNALDMEDSSGHKLITNHRSPQFNQAWMNKDFGRDPTRRSESISRLNGSPERLRASFESFRTRSKDRGRRRQEMKEPQSPTSDDNGSRTRTSRWPKRFVRSRSPSSSEESHGGKRRGHKRSHDHLGSRDDYDNAALEKHMMEMLAKEAEDSDGAIEKVIEQAKIEDPQMPIDRSKTNAQIFAFAKRRPSAPQRLRTDMPATKKHEIAARASLDEQMFAHRYMSSDDFDSTAPNSPTTSGLVPSIAINLSPPASPPSSAPSLRKPLPAKLHTTRKARSPSVNRPVVSEDDFEAGSGWSADISRQATNESQPAITMGKEQTTSPRNGLLSPKKGESLRGSIKSIKNGNAPDSRLRGLFKGGRIAELVGSEVSRVGDMLWKKDNSSYSSQINSPVASSFASEESVLDDGDLSAVDSSPKDNLARSKSNTEDIGKSSQTSPNGGKPKYHMSNLPNFQSSISRDKELSKISKAHLDHDHISRQQLALRERGRSSRFDRLAPPKIDMKEVSPSHSRSPSPEHAESQATYNEERQSSSSRSRHRVRSADRRLNALLDSPGKVGSGSLVRTGLSGLAVGQPEPQERSTLGEKRDWSISDRGMSAVRGSITKRDIARVRALLLSSGVKANEIARRAEETPEKPSLFLQDLEELFKGEVPHLPRSQEYILAGRTLVSNIEMTIQHLRDTTDHFAHNTVDKLHHRIKDIDDHVNYKLTPLVRAAADDADAFSTDLTTTHTLAVKQLNDSVDAILRRRRRRIRWARRWGWAMLEWTVLGIMWMVWFVVMIVQFVRGIVTGIIRGMRWLFWL